MYTECPECQTTFRLTAQILRQAQGRVRCGGCGSTFNALDNLSEEPPAPDTSDTQTAKRFEQESRELLETLDELSGGEDVRIEDTGAEWQVVDDDGDNDSDDASDNDGDDDETTDAAPAGEAGGGPKLRWTFTDSPDAGERPADDTESAAEAAADDSAALADEPADDAAAQATFDLGNSGSDDDELRFDDNTPLPDDFYSALEQRPRRRAGDRDEADTPREETQTAEETTQVDIELGDDDWQDLLAEVEASDSGPDTAESDTGEAAVAAGALSPAAGQPAAADADPARDEDEREDEALPETIAVDAAVAPQEEAEDRQAAEDTQPGDTGDKQPLEPAAAADDELTAEREIDQELLQAVADSGMGGLDAATSPWDEDPSLVETIIMEGDTFSDMLSAAEDADGDAAGPEVAAVEPELEDGQLGETGARKPPAMTPRQRYVAIAAIVLLGLLLAGQVVHANRESLATLGLFDSTLAPLYAALGNPITPAWDIRGWQFESTSGNTDESGSRLTINSRIANRSDGYLPYPLVHVSLTDRFDDVIGSRLLEPNEYLAGNASVSRPVAAGDDFTAVITVDAPSPDATGFKLNVCYPVTGKSVRCAIEDFRD